MAVTRFVAIGGGAPVRKKDAVDVVTQSGGRGDVRHGEVRTRYRNYKEPYYQLSQKGMYFIPLKVYKHRSTRTNRYSRVLTGKTRVAQQNGEWDTQTRWQSRKQPRGTLKNLQAKA